MDSSFCATGLHTLQDVYGTWQIEAIDVSEGEQAYGPNDPRLLGTKLIISQNEIRWDSDESYFKSKICLHPILRSSVREMQTIGDEITCDQGNRFGPKHVISIFSPSQIVIHWYDDVNAKMIKSNSKSDR